MGTERKAAVADNVYSDAENFGAAETRRGKSEARKCERCEGHGVFWEWGGEGDYCVVCDGTGYLRDAEPCYDAWLRPAARDLAGRRGENPVAVLETRMAARAAARARPKGAAGEVHVGNGARVAPSVEGPRADVLTAAVDAWLDSTVTPDLALCRSAVERAELRLSWVRHLLEVARPADPRWLQAVHRELAGALAAVESVRTVLVAEVPRGE